MQFLQFLQFLYFYPRRALQGSKYWRFSDKKMAAGYPKEISVGFAGIPNDIDTAFVWSGNGKTYFFKGKLDARR